MSERNNRGYVYSDDEIRDMIRCYFACDSKCSLARDLYVQLYPGRHIPTATTIYKKILQAQKNPNIDMDQLSMTDPRLLRDLEERQAIVYTKRLEEMQIFKNYTNHLSFKKLMQSISNESKPKLEKLVTNKKSNNAYATCAAFNEMVQKLNRVKLKTKLCDEIHLMMVENDQPLVKVEDTVETEDVKIDDPADIEDVNIDDAADIENVKIEDVADIEDVKIEDSIEIEDMKMEDTIEIVDDDTETPENISAAKTSIKSNNVHLYWRVYLSFVCPYANVNDLYYIDDTGSVADYYRINIDENYQVSDLNKYVGPVKTVVFRCCCWWKRQEFITLLRTIPKNSVIFMSKPHNCAPSNCTCCCKTKKPTKSKTLPKTNEDDELILLEQEISNALLKITEKHEKRKRWVVEGINKWLQELQMTHNYRAGGSMLINKGLKKVYRSENKVADETADKNDSTKCKGLSKYLWKYGHIVIHVSDKQTDQVCVYEIFQGTLISTAVIFCFNQQLRDLSFFLVDKLHETHDHLLPSLNVIRQLHVPCCWYVREAIIKHDAGHFGNNGALDFMRQPHPCPVGLCSCCCKSTKESVIIANAIDKKLWSQFQKKLLPAAKRPPKKRKPPSETVQVKKRPCTKIPPGQRSSEMKTLQVEILPGSKTLSAQIVPSPITNQTLSMVDQEVINLDDDEETESSPTQSNSVPPSSANPHDKPSSKITLIAPEMSCTITTYAMNEKESIDTTEADADPLIISDNQNDDPLNWDDTPVISAAVENKYPVGSEETFEIEKMPAENIIIDEGDPLSLENTCESKSDLDPITPQPMDNDMPTDVNVHFLISTILERFRDVRLYINNEGDVTADLNAPVSTLSNAELKVLANILAHAQDQVKSLNLRPGTILNGQFGMAGHLQRNLNINDPQSALYSPSNSNIIALPSTSTVTGDASAMPIIDNVFSLKDSVDGKVVESRVNKVSNTRPDEPKIRVRPPEELSVTEKAPILYNMLNGLNSYIPPIPNCPIFLPVDSNCVNIMPPLVPIASPNVLPALNMNEHLVRAPAPILSQTFLPDIVTSSIQTASNSAQVNNTRKTANQPKKVNKKKPKQSKVATPRTKAIRKKKTEKKVLPVTDILKNATVTGSVVPPTQNVTIFDVIEIDDD